MRVLFLDFDGVLNCGYGRQVALEPELVEQLRRVSEATYCQIVLSTSWRLFYSLEQLQEQLDLAGFPYPSSVIAKTPSLPNADRSEEIRAWLNAHTHDVDAWAAVDDTWLDPALVPNAVRTNKLSGLTPEKADELIAMLGGAAMR